MTAAFRTRDGMFSPASAQLAADTARASVVPATMSEVTVWADENGVQRRGVDSDGDLLDRVNRARADWLLPPFFLLPFRGEA